MGPNILVGTSLLLYPLAVAWAFSSLGPRRGVLASVLGGWLFLPSFDAAFGGRIPVIHTKAAFVPAVVLLVALLLDGARWRRLRPRLIDLPVLVLALSPLGASLSNDLGLYDGVAATVATAMVWAVPWFLGRVYLDGPGGIDALADSVVVAGLVYVPLCLWEVRMSPQLHRYVYGYSPFGSDFTQVMRFGGYRPSVFMADGLMASMFMAIATLLATWLWRCRARRSFWRVPVGWAASALGATTILSKSAGAILLLFAGLGVLEATRRMRTPVLILALLAAPPIYAAARISGWSGEDLAEVAERYIGADRADSVRFRMDNEDMLLAKALQRPWLGWGGWGRSRVYDNEGKDLTVTDGLWVLALGTTGLVGLLATWAALALPVLAFLRAFPSRFWADPRIAAAAACAVSLLAWTVDDIFNAMVTPVYPMIAGTLSALYLAARARRLHPRPGVASCTARLPAGRRLQSHGT